MLSPISMIALVVVCLTCAGFAQGVAKSQQAMDALRSYNELNSLAALLQASNPTAAFNPSAPGVHFQRGNPTFRWSSPSMAAPPVVKVSEEELQKSLAEQLEKFGEKHPKVYDTKFALGSTKQESGDLEAAATEFRESAAGMANILGDAHPDVFRAKIALARVLVKLDQEETALALKKEVDTLQDRTYSQGRKGMIRYAALKYKQGKVAYIQQLLKNKVIIFSIDFTNFTSKEIESLYQSLSGVSGLEAHAAKNSLMKRAVADYPNFDCIDSLLHGRNLWFMCDEEGVRPGLEAVENWLKENRKDKTSPIKGGAMDGQLLDAAGVTACSKLPNRQELMQRIAYAINQVPTKIARGINEVPTKLARGINAVPTKLAKGIKLAVEKGEEKGASKLGDI